MKTIALLLLIAGIARAQTNEFHFDLLHTLDGHSISNATVKRINASYVTVDFNGGGVRIAFTNLPVGVQRQFGFDPAQAQAEIELENRRRQETQQRQAAAMRAQQEALTNRLFRYVGDRLVPVSDFKQLAVKVSQVLTNGILGVNPVPNPVWGIGSPYAGAAIIGDKTLFIRCPTRGIVDGQLWGGFCYKAGTYSYLTVNGSEATVEKWDTGLTYLTRSDVVLTNTPSTRAHNSVNNHPEPIYFGP